MVRIINPNDLDQELVDHLKNNLSNHVWRDKHGFDTKIYDLTENQRKVIYNNLVEGRLNVLYIEEWKKIFEESFTVPNKNLSHDNTRNIRATRG